MKENFKILVSFMFEYMKEFLRRKKIYDQTGMGDKIRDYVVCRYYDKWAVHERLLDNSSYIRYKRVTINIHDTPQFVGTLSDCDAWIRLTAAGKIQHKSINHQFFV